MIHFENVDFSYSSKVKLLSDVNLQIKPGHIHGLLGKNGEGKSTMLKLIAGLLFPQKGKIDVMDFVPRKRNPEMLRDIYFLPEELPEHLLSIALFEKIYAPFYPNFSASIFDSCLKEFEIPSKDWKMNKLSYGQKKKIFVAFGLATQTKLLLMDEPTNGLDIPSKGQFRRMVASVLDENRCVIISTHQVRDLDSLIAGIMITYIIGNLLGTFLNNMLSGINIYVVMNLFQYSPLQWTLFTKTAMLWINGIPTVDYYGLFQIFIAFLLSQSMFFLGGIYFKKNQTFVTFLTFIVFGLFVSLLTITEIRLIHGNIFEKGVSINFRCGPDWWIYTKQIFGYLLVPFFWVVSYFRLTEKQV
ncbi:MAG: ATP-binding cassette domain-containing protein [Candidatus Azobacteroides sp.]|nr:ATP-binding cassette domain-containing protein [Candidatus Azobacteroides sp.]